MGFGESATAVGPVSVWARLSDPSAEFVAHASARLIRAANYFTMLRVPPATDVAVRRGPNCLLQLWFSDGAIGTSP